MGRYVAVLFADLERHTDAWRALPRDTMVAVVSEYRYAAESLAGLYGALYREWAGDGHMFLFENVDSAAQFALRLLDRWRARSATLPKSLPLRLGCHFGDCTPLEGEGWIGRGNAIAKRVESEAEPDALYVTESVLDLLDLPLYRFERVGALSLKGDYLPERVVYRLVEFDGAALRAKSPEEMTAEDWFLRAASLIGSERENTEEEADCYRRALDLRPDYPEAHVNLAIVLRVRGDHGGAARHYQAALALRPDYPEAHYNYAALLAAKGRNAGAADHYREALSVRADYVDANHGYANLLAATERLEEAAGLYERTLRLRPEYAEAHNNYAVLLEKAGDPDGAAKHYRQALRLAPAYPEAHYNYALFLEASGDRSGAEDHYRAAIAAWPDYGEAHNNLAVLLHGAGDVEQALHHYEHALAARPADPEVHYNYALLLRRLGDEEKADGHFRTAAELAPDVSVFRSAVERP